MPTPECLTQGAYSRDTYSEVPTWSCSPQGYLLRGVYSKVLTPRLFTRLWGSSQGSLATRLALYGATRIPEALLNKRLFEALVSTGSALYEALGLYNAPRSTILRSRVVASLGPKPTPRTQHPGDYARAYAQKPMPRSLRPGGYAQDTSLESSGPQHSLHWALSMIAKYNYSVSIFHTVTAWHHDNSHPTSKPSYRGWHCSMMLIWGKVFVFGSICILLTKKSMFLCCFTVFNQKS